MDFKKQDLYKMENGVVMRLNNGADRDENPYISFRAHLLDKWNALLKPEYKLSDIQNMFEDILNKYHEEEIKHLSKDLRNACLEVIRNVLDHLQRVFTVARDLQRGGFTQRFITR